MAVTLDNNSGGQSGNGTTITITGFTTAGSNKVLFFSGADPAGGTQNSVSYNGVSMTSQVNNNIRVWTLPTPATSGNFSVNLSAYGGLLYEEASFNGADDTGTPFGTAVTASVSSTTSSTGSITCPTNGAIYGAEFNGYTPSPAPTINSGTLLVSVRSGAGGQGSASAYRTSTGSLAWNLSASQNWWAGGVPINPVPGATFIAKTNPLPKQAVNRSYTY